MIQEYGGIRYDDEAVYLVTIGPTKTTRVIYPRSSAAGWMVYFYDAVTGAFAGCCGVEWFDRNAIHLGRHDVQLPSWPSL